MMLASLADGVFSFSAFLLFLGFFVRGANGIDGGVRKREREREKGLRFVCGM